MNEYHSLKDELVTLYQEVYGSDDEVGKGCNDNGSQQSLYDMRKRAADTCMKMSEEIMRDARGDKILMFLKLRYPDQVNIDDEQQCEQLKQLYFKYEKELSEYDNINIIREGQAVRGFLKDLDKMGL